MTGAKPTARRLAIFAAVSMAALGYAGLSTALAFDRAATSSPAFIRLVPEPFRQQALASTGKALVLSGRTERLGPLAETLIRRDPMAPQAAGLLGIARLAQGNSRGANSAFRTSAKLGWRDASTQVYWLQAALAADDLPRAGTRFNAIARQWPAAPAIDQLSERIEGDAGGQMLIAQQVASGANWAKIYAQPQPGQSLVRLAARAKVLILAARLGERLGCDAAVPMVARLASAQPALANEVWIAQCPRAAQPGMVNDAGFELAGEANGRTPFDWQFPGNGALQADVIPASSGGALLRASSAAATLVSLAMQRIVLPTGPYHLAWHEAGVSHGRSSRIAASLTCRPERALADPQSGRVEGGQGSIDLVFTGGCEAPVLQLWLTPGTGAVSIDDIVLTRR